MSLKSSNKVETNRYELTVEVDGVTFENAVNKVYKKEVKRINIPGFRKGKAPRAIIEKMYQVYQGLALYFCFRTFRKHMEFQKKQ